MFIDIPKLFDKNFVAGYLLPSILFTLLTSWPVQLAYNFQLIDFQLNWVQQNGRSVMVAKIPDVPEATLTTLGWGISRKPATPLFYKSYTLNLRVLPLIKGNYGHKVGLRTSS